MQKINSNCQTVFCRPLLYGYHFNILNSERSKNYPIYSFLLLSQLQIFVLNLKSLHQKKSKPDWKPNLKDRKCSKTLVSVHVALRFFIGHYQRRKDKQLLRKMTFDSANICSVNLSFLHHISLVSPLYVSEASWNFITISEHVLPGRTVKQKCLHMALNFNFDSIY